jgi:hypothetical protein
MTQYNEQELTEETEQKLLRFLLFNLPELVLPGGRFHG